MKNLFLCIAFLVMFTARSQERQAYNYINKPLLSVLKDIQNKHQLIFSFANDLINEREITLVTNESITLDELLLRLEDQTNLTFDKVSDSQIVISEKESYFNNQILDKVIVSGYVTTGIDRNKDGSIDVTGSSLGILPGLVAPDILQSIQLVPGIRTLDESASGIQIRGGSPDQNLILFDDIKMFNSGYLYGMISAFNPYATKKAKLFKSGASAAYGDRISGIIDISTGDSIPVRTAGGFGMDGLSIDAFVKTPLSKRLAVYIFTRRSYTDILKSPTYDGYAEKIFRNGGVVRDINGADITVENDDEYDVDSSTNTFSFYDVNAKVIFSPNEKDKIILSSLFTRNNLDFSFTGDGETKNDSLVTKNNGISLKWIHKNAERQREEISTYFSKYNSFYLNDEIENNTLEETSIRTNLIRDFGLNIKSSRTFNNNHALNFGYQLSSTKVSVDIIKTKPLEPEDNESIIESDVNLKNALFGEYTYRLGNSGILSSGLRIVHYGSVGKLYLEPRFNFEYPLTEKLRIKSSIERRNQPISQLVEFNQTELRLENNLWRLSDDRTYPLLQSNQISGGLLFYSKGWTIDIDGYYKRIKGLTTFTSGFSTPQLTLSNGKSDITGLDFLVKKRIQNYRIWVGYTYNTINFSFPSIQSKGFSGNNDITHSFRISNTVELKNFQLSAGWQYRTGEPYTPILSFNSTNSVVEFGSINSRRLADYHRLDISAIYNFKLGNRNKSTGQLGLSFLNIYNRRKPLSILYRTEEESVGLELKQVIQRHSLGFTPNLSFRVFL